MSLKYLILALLFFIAASLLGWYGLAGASEFDDGINGEVFRSQISYTTRADEWTTTNKWLFAGAIGAFVIGDTWSTYCAVESGRGVEANPLFGEYPRYTAVAVSKVVMLTATYLAIEYLIDEKDRQETRNWVYGGMTVLGIGVTTWNASL